MIKRKQKEKTGSAVISADNTSQSTGSAEHHQTRRAFLRQAAAAGFFGGSLVSSSALSNKSWVSTQPADVCQPGQRCERDPLTGTARADAAKQRRIDAANYERNMTIPSHPCNGDEQLYSSQNYFASYTKGLQKVGDFGEVDPAAYNCLLFAINTGNPWDFENVPLGFNNDCNVVSDEEARLGRSGPFPPNKQRRLESPQAGYNFDLEGKDIYQLISGQDPSGNNAAFPEAFTFSSCDEAVEIIENYWQALTRDVAFIDYQTHSLIQAAVTDLNRPEFLACYHGPCDPNQAPCVTPKVYSRGILPGDISGPFVSQFLWRDNIPYGAQKISSMINSPRADYTLNDFMTTPAEWLMIQTGQTPNRVITPDGIRYIRSGRDLTAYVRNDAVYQAYLNAALLLLTPQTSGGLGVPLNPNNPYRVDPARLTRYCKQLNFVELGVSQLLSLLGEVSVRAHKAIWYQKWQVHRRLRPEEFGGRVHFNFTHATNYPINPIISNSGVFSKIYDRYTSYFLPQAYPEGSPLHPSYGAGHATLAGACVTILKAWFDSELPYTNFASFVQANANGDALVSVPISDSTNTIAQELNKLASNIAIGRDIAGLHWRSDYARGVSPGVYAGSVFLGEQVAIQLLQDWGFTYNEKPADFPGFVFRDFRGNLITVGGTQCPGPFCS